MPFCVQGRYFFLTYSQTRFNEHDTIITHLRSIPGQPYRFCLVGRERHGDGGTHFHVFVDWGKRRKFTSESRFDIDNHHPNIQSARDPAAALQYCEKDNDTVHDGDRPDLSAPERVGRNELWRAILDESTSSSDFMSRVRDADPYTFATRYQALDTMARAVYPTVSAYESPYDAEDFVLPEGIQSWLLEQFTPEVSTVFSICCARFAPIEPATRGSSNNRVNVLIVN